MMASYWRNTDYWEDDDDDSENEVEALVEKLSEEYAAKLWIEEREARDRSILEEMGLPYNDVTTGGLSYKVRNGNVYQEMTGKDGDTRSSPPGVIYGYVGGAKRSSTRPRHGHGPLRGGMGASPSQRHSSNGGAMTSSAYQHGGQGVIRGNTPSSIQPRHGQGLRGSMTSPVYRHGQGRFPSPPCRPGRGSARGASSAPQHSGSIRGEITTSPSPRHGQDSGAIASSAHKHGTELAEGYIGEAVSFLRVYLIRKNNRTLQCLLSLVRQIPESKCRSEIKKFLGSSLNTLKSFVMDQCGYFSVKNGVVSLMPCKTKPQIHDILRRPRPTGNVCPPQIEVINDVKRCARLMYELLAEEVVAVDCEGECLGVTGRLTLVQLSTVKGEVYLVDILSGTDKDQLFHAGRLKELLEDVHVVKVMHNCRSDSAALFCQFGVTLRNVFDTECAYTTILEKHNINKRQNNPGINLICELFGGHFNQVNEDIKWKMVHDNYYWSYRPMSKQMIEYAAADVFALLPQVYYNMKRELDPCWTSMFTHLCQDNIDCHLKKEGLV